MEHVGARKQRHQGRDGGERLGGDVLKLVGDDIAAPRELGQRGEILVACVDLAMRNGARRTICLRLEDVDAVAHRLRSLRQHAPKLAAAEDAEGFTGEENNDGGLRVGKRSWRERG